MSDDNSVSQERHILSSYKLISPIGSLDIGKCPDVCIYVCMYVCSRTSKGTHFIPSLPDQPRLTQLNPTEPNMHNTKTLKHFNTTALQQYNNTTIHHYDTRALEH